MNRLHQIIFGMLLLFGFQPQNGVASPFFGEFNKKLGFQPKKITTTSFLECSANRLSDNKVELVWKTASEENSEGFQIERLLEGETEWLNVGWLKGFGTAHSKHLYRWVDDNYSEGDCYYRIKQQDVDSNFVYSEVILVKGKTLHEEGIRLFPVPTKDYIHVDFGEIESTLVAIKIITKDGRLMFQGEKKINENQILTITETANFPAGVYVMQMILIDGKTVVQKFFKEMN